MPLKFQLNVVEWQLAKNKNNYFSLCLNWLFKYWNKRYQSLLDEKSDLFVYKKRTNNLNYENDFIDEDKLEV